MKRCLSDGTELVVIADQFLILDPYGNSAGAPVSDVLLALHRYQQAQHGERVEARQLERGGAPS